jgi:flagellar secretion chaperone FliS
MNHQISTYADVDTLGRSQVELILKVYTGAQTSLEAAHRLYTDGDYTNAYAEVEKARKFIVHLYTTLNFEDGGDVAANLGRMYVFMLSEFDAIEATKNTKHLESCIKILKNMRNGWEGVRDSEKNAAGHSGFNETEPDEKSGRSIVMSA